MGKAKSGNVGIRFFWPLINTYGEGEKSTRLINTTIRKIVLGEEPALSNGNQYYDFVHVEDVAHALYLIAEKGVVKISVSKILQPFSEICKIHSVKFRLFIQ